MCRDRLHPTNARNAMIIDSIIDIKKNQTNLMTSKLRGNDDYEEETDADYALVDTDEDINQGHANDDENSDELSQSSCLSLEADQIARDVSRQQMKISNAIDENLQDAIGDMRKPSTDRRCQEILVKVLIDESEHLTSGNKVFFINPSVSFFVCSNVQVYFR